MRRILSAILLSLSMFNQTLASPFIRPQPPEEPVTTIDTKPDPEKLDEAAATVTALKHCLSMDGSLNQESRLIDAYNHQPDLQHLPLNMSDAEREKTILYMQNRPDIPDFGFLIADTWRITPRNTRIKFNALIALKLTHILGFEPGAYAFNGNCKPVMLGNIATSGNFSHAIINMPLAFNNKEVQLSYLMTKQTGYNWQIEDLLIDNAGVANYVQKDLARAISQKGIEAFTKDICQTSNIKSLNCN